MKYYEIAVYNRLHVINGGTRVVVKARNKAEAKRKAMRALGYYVTERP